MTSPEISVIMPVYNCGKYLNEAIDSILQQTFSDFEFIIINDGSKDNSLEIIKSYYDKRIVIINQKNQGVAISLNNGIKRAKGKYIARMDADDFSYKDRFAIQLNFLEENSNVIVVGSNADIIDKDGTYVYTTDLQLTSIEIKNKLLLQSPFIHPSVIMRKEALEKSCFYPDVPIGQDLFLFNTMSKYGDYANIKKPLIKYRLTPTASTRRSKATQRELTKAFKYFNENGKLKDQHVELIKRSFNEIDMNEKYYRYNLLLAKKYLWNNYQPRLARQKLKKAITLNYRLIEPLLLYLTSFLPRSMIQGIYNRLK